MITSARGARTLLRATVVDPTRRLRKLNGKADIHARPTTKTIVDDRQTRKMYALELNRLLANDKRNSLPHRSRLTCDYQFAPLPRPCWMQRRRAPFFGVLAAISGLLVYLFLH